MSLRPKAINYPEVWQDFRSKIAKLYENGSLSKDSGVTMYENVYAMCNARPKPFTETLFVSIAQYLADVTSESCKRMLEHDDLVSAYALEWDRFQTATLATNLTCEYLNRSIVKPTDPAAARQMLGDLKVKRQTVDSLAQLLWRDRVFATIKFEHGDRLMFLVLEYLKMDRLGDVVPAAALSRTISSLVDCNRYTPQRLNMYQTLFETPYLDQTLEFYTQRANQAAEDLSVGDYMTTTRQILDQEVDRNRKYCDKSTFDKAIRIVEVAYIETHQRKIQSEFSDMVKFHRLKDCSLAVKLLARIPKGLDPLLESFEEIVSREGKDLTAELGQAAIKDPSIYVHRLVELYKRYADIASNVLSSALFEAAVDRAFRKIVNDSTSQIKAPEVLSKFSDVVLKKGNRSEGDVDQDLSSIITLFNFIDDKDVFQHYYSRFLARRLIQGTSSSDEAEANMIGRLKTVCGVEYTSKLQRMFTDMTISSELAGDFRSFLEDASWKGIDFHVLVLTAGSWPLSHSTTDFILPTELEKGVVAFNNFYTGRFNGRRLQWLHNLGKADVKLGYLDKRYDVTMSFHQLAILLQFSDRDTISLKELEDATRLDVNKIASTMVESGLLVKEDVYYKLNFKFSSKRLRFKLPTITDRDTPMEAKKEVDDDRRLHLQAAIVRVMKARRSLTHNSLIQEVIDQVKNRFTPNVLMIKQCIEQLIEKQYLERETGSLDKYVYVA